MNASFYPVFSSFWNLIPFFLPARPVSALVGLHSIKFCTFLSPFRTGLTNPGRALGRFCPLPFSLKLLTLSGIPPFFTNAFRLASLLALLVGLNISFLIGALLWFFKTTKAVPFESVEVFRKDPFLALYFSLFSLMIFRPLCLLPTAAFFTLTIWPFGPPPPRSPLRWRPHKETTHKATCFDWGAGPSTGVFLPMRECEASFFSVDPHQANLQPNLLLLDSRLRFNPTPTFLGVTFDCTLSFTKHVSSLKAKFFPCLKASRCISASSWGPSKESLSLLYKSFLRPRLTYASPGWFPFLSATNITKLERLHRAASRAITDCLSSSPIPLLLTEASLPPLRVTLTQFTFLSYERALRLPTSFPISGLARHGVKPRLCRSSWKAFASTHPLMLPSTCSREALLVFPPCPPWNLPSFTVESTLPTPCSRSDSPHSRQSAALAHLDSFPPHDLIFWTDGSVRFPFGKGGSGVLANCSLCGTEASLSFSAGPVCSSFSAEACAILHALCWSRQHQQACHISSVLLLSDSRSVFSSTFPFISNSVADLAGIVFSLLLFYQATMGPRTLVYPGKDTADELARRGALLAPSAISCSLSPLILDWRRTVSSTYFDTQVPSISTEELVLPVSSLVFAAMDAAFFQVLTSLGLAELRTLLAAPVDTRPRTSLISFCTVQLRTLCAAHSLATLCLCTTSGPDPGELPGFWGSVVFHHAPIPRKGSGNQQQQQQVERSSS